MKNQHFVITISHQLGCGGSDIGRELSKELKVPFVDRDILKQVSDQLNVAEKDLEHREERLSSFWEEFTRLQLYTEPLANTGAQYLPSDKELFYLESKYIVQIAKESSVVILGRGGRYLLHDYPHRFSIFVSADLPDRIKRVSALYDISEEEAVKKIHANDKGRAAYNRAFTKSDSLDVRLYDMVINTSSVGEEIATKIVLEAARARLRL